MDLATAGLQGLNGEYAIPVALNYIGAGSFGLATNVDKALTSLRLVVHRASRLISSSQL